MRFLPSKLSPQTTNLDKPLAIDSVGNHFLGQNSDFLAVETTGDGNCLFNAISLGIQNNENLAVEIRYRTCLEMIMNRAFYINEHKHDGLTLVSGTYDDSMKACSENFSFSSAFTIHATATVIGKPIRSLYPAVNGIFDNSIGILNRFFSPRNSKSQKNPLCILWSSCLSYPGYGTWTPNHFVFLSSKNDKHNVLNISDENEFPSLSVASNVPVTKSVPDTDITHFEFTEHTVATHSDTDMSHTEEHHTDTSQSDVHHTDTSHTEEHHTNMSHNEEHTDTSDTDNITQTDMHQDTHTTTSTCDESLVYIQEPYRNPNVNGLDGKFLSPDTLLNITLQDHADAPHTIPDGTKENVFFVINNTSNKQTEHKQARSFVDDCGVWQRNKNSLKTTDYIRSETGSLTTIFKKNNVYCREIKRQMIPLDPQPDSSTVIKLKRYYSKLAKDNNYQRRVSWFENLVENEDSNLHLEIVEYIGTYPGESIHGNSKHTSQPYKRVSVKQKAIISDGIKHGKIPIKILKDVNDYDPDNPIDLKVVQNAKYNEQKRQRPTTASAQNNMADDIQTIINNLHLDPYIKSVIANNNLEKKKSATHYSLHRRAVRRHAQLYI
ncbi:hypothetical protein FSP39_016804 [Pinctada imbricata]|uniref:OTU domain-containing protein n=1 Tax=Pinctada imbricata TaxID=66713 RepID=A0AA88YWA4_PINIB|nr:hypothetical protein FSP39_016804 [Pinctada imbricata]